jgi:hypothetical protein
MSDGDDRVNESEDRADQEGETSVRGTPSVLASAVSESREVLDHELEIRAELDDKAVWSVRTAVIVLGLVISAGSITTPPKSSFPWYSLALIGVGVTALLSSLIVGVSVSIYTSDIPGIGPKRRMDAHLGVYDEPEWLARLLVDYHAAIGKQQRLNNKANRVLSMTQLLVVGGAVAVTLGSGALVVV